MECVPAVNAEVENVAWPALRETTPICAAPSRNVTVPVGVPDALLTVAVKVTEPPAVEGLSEEATAEVVGWPFTVCVIAAEVLVLKVASP